jgi:hypothetical protein
MQMDSTQIEVDSYIAYKSGGQRHYDMAKINTSLNCYASRSHHYRQDKARGFRRDLDRTSHHRRRNAVRDVIAHGRLSGAEAVPPPSSSKLRGCQWSSSVSGHKNLCH